MSNPKRNPMLPTKSMDEANGYFDPSEDLYHNDSVYVDPTGPGGMTSVPVSSGRPKEMCYERPLPPAPTENQTYDSLNQTYETSDYVNHPANVSSDPSEEK